MTDLTWLTQPAHQLSRSSKLSQSLGRLLLTIAALVAVWQGLIMLFDLPPYLLPTPLAVLEKLVQRYDVLLYHSWITGQEIILTENPKQEIINILRDEYQLID
mgnify:CR=1 FL=1